MKRVLITGARAPAALELIRRLAIAGYIVYAADSVHFPLSRASRYLTNYFLLPEPIKNAAIFAEKLAEIIQQHGIDILIPTCEEVFFISRYRNQLAQHSRVFCTDFPLLRQLHDKYQFTQLAAQCQMPVPTTIQLTSQTQLMTLSAQANAYVFKPVFSRFAAHTLIRPSLEKLGKIQPSAMMPWVAQTYIAGQEYCTYSIAVNGVLQAHVTYLPRYRVGLGSSIYFQSVQHPRIYAAIAQLVHSCNYTGQIGFDCIENTDGEIFFLECNPRATSGIHCLPQETDWSALFLGAAKPFINTGPSRMISAAMLLFAAKYVFSKEGWQFLKDFYTTQDVISNKQDKYPALYQICSLAEIIGRALRHGVSLKDAATADIEWNGQAL